MSHLFGLPICLTLSLAAAFSPSLGYSASVTMAPTVNPVAPYSFPVDTATHTINVAGVNFISGAPAGFDATMVDTNSGFRAYDFTYQQLPTRNEDLTGQNYVLFDVSVPATPAPPSLSPGAQWMLVIWNPADPTKRIPIAAVGLQSQGSALTSCYGNLGDSSGNAPCLDPQFSSDTNVAAGVYFNKTNALTTVVRIGLYLQDICNSGFTTTEGCTATGTSEVDPSTDFNLNFTLVQYSGDGLTTSPVLATTDKFTNVKINVENANLGPTACPTTYPADLYFPGDSAITLKNSYWTLGASPPANSSEVLSAVVVANVGSSPNMTPASFSANTLARRVAYPGVNIVSGFTNSPPSPGAPVDHFMRVLLSDQAGVLSVDTPACEVTGVEVSPVGGFLNTDHCFIATAAHGSKDAPPVKILRRFRDHFLRSFNLGEKFIGWYYQHSPPWAQWLKAHPWAKIPVLGLLIPVQTLAYFAESVSAQEAVETGSAQPFIDRQRALLKEEEDEEESGPKKSFTEREREIILKEEAEDRDSDVDYSKSFIQREREKIEAEESESGKKDGKSFIEKTKEKIAEADREDEEDNGPKETSAIKKVKDGKSELSMKRPGNIHYAMGFKMGASIARSFVATDQLNSFASVYRDTWVPDLQFFGEYQPFHSEWFGNFGFVFASGISFFKGYGIFKNGSMTYSPQMANAGAAVGQFSQVIYRFMAIPVLAGLNYRFNLFRVLRPYAQVLPGIIGYGESRSDTGQTVRGMSRVIILSGGVNIPVDWISHDSAWSLYESFGVKKMYITLDYTRSQNISGAVDFSYSGVSAGFTVEY